METNYYLGILIALLIAITVVGKPGYVEPPIDRHDLVTMDYRPAG